MPQSVNVVLFGTEKFLTVSDEATLAEVADGLGLPEGAVVRYQGRTVPYEELGETAMVAGAPVHVSSAAVKHG